MEHQKRNIKDFLRPKAAALTGAVILALCGVFFGIVPYIAVYQLLMELASSQCTGSEVLIYAAVILGCFGLQLLCHYSSTAISHTAAFSITESMRLAITKKMLKMPLGYTQEKGSGYFKNTLMDELERMEYPLAHAIPETTSGVLLPFAIMIMLFILDWRMGLAVAVPAIATLLFYLPMYLGNVRFFNIEGTEDMLIDTVGMSTLFLPDLQYHFHGMDPNWVVNHAYNVASYILANDNPIEDGETVDGVEDGQMSRDVQWKCRYEDALIQPPRAVLDINMGEYAAGNRD